MHGTVGLEAMVLSTSINTILCLNHISVDSPILLSLIIVMKFEYIVVTDLRTGKFMCLYTIKYNS